MKKCKCGKKAKWQLKDEYYCDSCANNILNIENKNKTDTTKYYLEDLFLPISEDKIYIGEA